MSMLSLAISYMTMSSLPWFMDLTFQVPMQYCSLQYWTLLSPPDTSTAECQERSSCFGPGASFLLEPLVTTLCSSLVAYWMPSDLELIFQHHVFLPFSYCPWGLPFPSPVGHVLSELFTMTRGSWVALHRMAHSFTELCQPLCHNEVVIHEEIRTEDSGMLQFMGSQRDGHNLATKKNNK